MKLTRLLLALLALALCVGCPASGGGGGSDDDDDSASPWGDDDDASGLVTCPGDYFVVPPDQVSKNKQLHSDAQVSTVLSDIGHCEVIEGLLAILGTPLTNLDGLSSLTSVGGLSLGDNNALTNIDGLSSLVSVGGNLVIQVNDALPNLVGLMSLSSVGGDVDIYANPALCQTSIDAFIAACTIGGSTFTYNNNDGC
jgi:hypothetical protein